MWDLFSGLSWTSCLMLLWSLLFLCKVLLVCFVLLVLTLFPHNRMWNFSKAGFTSDSTLYLAFSNLLLLFVNLQVYWLFQKLKLSSKPHHSPLILESGEKWIVMTWLALLVEVANIPAETSNPVQYMTVEFWFPEVRQRVLFFSSLVMFLDWNGQGLPKPWIWW